MLDLVADPPIARLPESLFRAPAETFELLLGDVFEQHGSPEAWVASFSIADSTIDRLRAGLVAPWACDSERSVRHRG